MAKKKVDEGPLPRRKARADLYKRIQSLPEGERYEAARKLFDERAKPDQAARARFEASLQEARLPPEVTASLRKAFDAQGKHPDLAAKTRIEASLQEVHLHPDLRASPELSRLVSLFRELLHGFVPGETMEQALEPLQTLMARRGGGRPAQVDHEQVRRFHARLTAANHHDPTSQTAAEFGIATRTVREILAG